MDQRRLGRLKEATIHSVRAGKAEDGLKAVDHLIEEAPQDAELHQIRGIALTRLERTTEALAAFRTATELEPTSHRHHYNLAWHLYQLGQAEEARTALQASLAILPDNPAAKRLRDAIDGKADLVDVPSHILPWLDGRESAWDRAAYGLMALGGLLAGLMIFRFPASPTGAAVKKGQLPDVALRTDALSQLTVFLFVLSTVATFMWLLADVVDRRKRFTWLIPATICGLFGLNVVALALYFFVGRRFGEIGSRPA